MEIRRVHLLILGRVQGVGFRHVAVREARRLGISGWVANRPDGSVEMEIQGFPDAVATMLKWCERGPATAFVREIRTRDIPPREDTLDFTILF
jgi:acylphosphatase